MSSSPTRAEIEALIHDLARHGTRGELAEYVDHGAGRERMCDRAHATLRALLDEREKAEADLARMRPAAEAVEKLEKWMGLHERIDILYVVDGFAVALSRNDGDDYADSEFAPTLPAAILAALAALAAVEKAEAGK
jgi:hypothetical protein